MPLMLCNLLIYNVVRSPCDDVQETTFNHNSDLLVQVEEVESVQSNGILASADDMPPHPRRVPP
jgi:hypothetical protein